MSPAITASFSVANGVLSIFGDELDNTLVASRDAAGTILVNGGAVPVQGGTPTVVNTVEIRILGQRGNDNLSLDEANGPLPRSSMFGGAGNDTITGGAGDDQLFGQRGNDILFGKGDFDFLFGGEANDTLPAATPMIRFLASRATTV